jgi:hypothetical protein
MIFRARTLHPGCFYRDVPVPHPEGRHLGLAFLAYVVADLSRRVCPGALYREGRFLGFSWIFLLLSSRPEWPGFFLRAVPWRAGSRSGGILA